MVWNVRKVLDREARTEAFRDAAVRGGVMVKGAGQTRVCASVSGASARVSSQKRFSRFCATCIR